MQRASAAAMCVLLGSATDVTAQRAGAAAIEAARPAVSRETRPVRVRAATPRWHEAATISVAWRGVLFQAVPTGDRIALIGTRDQVPGLALVSMTTGAVVEARDLDAGCVPQRADGAGFLVATCGAALVAFDPATLAERWRVPFAGEAGAMSAAGELLLVAAYPGEGALPRMIAFDHGGRERWRIDIPATRFGISEDTTRVYAWEGDPTVWAVDRRTGAMLWATPMAPLITGVLPLTDGSIAVARADRVVRLDGATGRIGDTLVDAAEAAADAAGSWIYAVSDDGGFRGDRLHGHDTATGRRWTYRRPIAARTVVAGDGVVYACSATGVLHAVDAATGAGRWWADTGGSCDVHQVGPVTLASLNDERLVIVDGARTSHAPRVTVRGRFRDDVGGAGVRHKRVWIGDQVVRTDARGRFSARVRRGAAVTFTMDPRDVPSNVDYAVLAPDGAPRVDLSTYYEDCH